jgi:hypothetical protein
MFSKKDLAKGAGTFQHAGINYFEREDYETAGVFLGLAWRLYKNVGDKWNTSITWPRYETACEKVGIAP